MVQIKYGTCGEVGNNLPFRTSSNYFAQANISIAHRGFWRSDFVSDIRFWKLGTQKKFKENWWLFDTVYCTSYNEKAINLRFYTIFIPMVGHPVWGGPNFQKQGVFVHPFPTALTTIRNLKRLLTSVFILHIRKSILKGQRPERELDQTYARVSHSWMFHTSWRPMHGPACQRSRVLTNRAPVSWRYQCTLIHHAVHSFDMHGCMSQIVNLLPLLSSSQCLSAAQGKRGRPRRKQAPLQ